jgi:tetratricopeptide (TPR) repeat protein
MALIYKGGFESGIGLYDSAIALLRQGIDCLRPIVAGRIVGLALNMLAAALSMKGQYVEARASLEESLEQFGWMRDPWGTAFSLNDLGMMLHLRFHDDAGEHSCEQSRDIFQRVGDNRGQALAVSNLALIAVDRGDYQRATRLHREALTLHEASDDQWGLAVSRIHLGQVLAITGDMSGADDQLRRGLIIAWENTITPVALEALSELAALEIAAGDRDTARTTLTAIVRHPSVHDPVRERAIALLQGLGSDDVATSPIPGEDRWAIRTVNEMTRALVDKGLAPASRR